MHISFENMAGRSCDRISSDFWSLSMKMNEFPRRSRYATAKKPFLIGKCTIFRVFSGDFMKMNAFQGNRWAVTTKNIRSLFNNWRFPASLSTPDSTVAAWNSGFWNSGTPKMFILKEEVERVNRPSNWPFPESRDPGIPDSGMLELPKWTILKEEMGTPNRPSNW